MVYRVYSEKKEKFALEAKALLSELKSFLGISGIEKLRIIHRYDVENISRELFEYSKTTVFSEPPLDDVSETVSLEGAKIIAVEYLPGQYDQRADSAAQCIQIISTGDRPLVKSATIYAFYGQLSSLELGKIKTYLINPVEAREASMQIPDSLEVKYDIPTCVDTVDGFTDMNDEDLSQFISSKGLAMDLADAKFCRDYFKSIDRNPTITEIKVIDTYWSDHCRHTTFGTVIQYVKFEDKVLQDSYQRYLDTRKFLGIKKNICLMDIATIAVKYLRKTGQLEKLDESKEINACTVNVEIEVDGVKEPWLLLFKNETHNHPTEIEPFGGAATCIGGAIRDPLSGRAYVYGAMRVTGAADPRKALSETLAGKLPQRKIVSSAAAGYSSYGNQIGLATGIVDEIYHPGYEAKRMEVGAVIAAVPKANVRREEPIPGDVVILLGGSTGRDGIGGATGSSKAHNIHSVETCGAEVQKGNAPEERKLQRLFRNPQVSRMIKRCNDFGAGGVSVAVGELADGLEIDLNAVPRKYEGLDGTELAISESQERMAVVVAVEDAGKFLEYAASENLQAVKLAAVTLDPKLVMNWNGKKIVDLDRSFLDSNGAEKTIDISASKAVFENRKASDDFEKLMRNTVSDINCCSKRGLAERFDSTIGSNTVLMPFGGKNQLTPAQAMVQKISVEKKHTEDCSFMAFGYNPFISEQSPYHGAYLAIVESVSKLIASGAEFKDVYLSLQEYFEKLGCDSKRWGKPLAALLGAFDAQMDLGIGAIGGKDSMSGSFEDISVPPTLISFAVTTQKCQDVISNEFKKAGSFVAWLRPSLNEKGTPDPASLKNIFDMVNKTARSGKLLAAYTPGIGGAAEAVFKMCIGNSIGFNFSDSISNEELTAWSYGSFILELSENLFPENLLGMTIEEQTISKGDKALALDELSALYEGVLEDVYPCNIASEGAEAEIISSDEKCFVSSFVKTAKPKVVIPAFPGTNCEYDSAKAMADAGADPEIVVIRNLSAEAIVKSTNELAAAIRKSQMIFIPGGFSGGDEPDGSGKFITALFKNAAVKQSVTELLDLNGGLICGICNGFQALIKLGLLPYGKIIDTDENCPTLSFNPIGRHQSKIVRTRISSVKTPWLSECNVGEIYNVPISHGEGRFIAPDEVLENLIRNSQIVTQYCDPDGNVSMDIRHNPNGSIYAVEGICSPDGRVFGKMGHSERKGSFLYKNVPGKYDMHMFESAVKFFK